MSRAVHNAFFFGEDIDLSDFECEKAAFNVFVWKNKLFRPCFDYFNLFDEDEFFQVFYLTKPTVDKVLNKIIDQL